MNASSTSNAAVRGILWIVGLGLCVGLYFGLDLGFLHQWTRAAGNNLVSVYLLTPDVSPGDSVKLAVEVIGGEAAAIDAIDLPDQDVHVQGRGSHWGSSVRSQVGRTSQDVAFTAPPEQGEKTIRIRVAYTLAVSTDARSFRNEKDAVEIALPLTVSSPSAALAVRAARGVLALALLAGFWLVLHRFGRGLWSRLWKADKAPAGKAADGSALGMTMIGIAGVLVYVGYRWFALNLVAATGIASDVFVAAMTVVWVVAPPLLVRRRPPLPEPLAANLRRLGPAPAGAPPGYRAAPPGEVPRAIDAPALRQAIEAIPARVDSRRGGLAVWVGKAKNPVMIAFDDPRAITLEALRVAGRDFEPLVAVACAVAPQLGAFELWFAGVMAVVDGTRSAEEITREMQRAHEARVERIAAALRPKQ